MWLSLPLGRAPLLHDQFQLLPLPLSQQAQECLNFRFGHPGHRQQLRNRWQRLNRGSGRVMMITRVMPNPVSVSASRRCCGSGADIRYVSTVPEGVGTTRTQ
jgi:hypothetical protein